ncbi:nucleotide exchange factor GrpE [Patescibacteria group bacterium]
MDFNKDLEKYAKGAIEAAKKKFDLTELTYDHICYQTVSSKDYENTLKKLKDEIKVVIEIPHAGRRTTIACLHKPFNKDGVIVNKVEISEPKPKKTVKKKEFDHIAFVVKDDFDNYIEALKKKGIDIGESKQIGDHKIVKILVKGFEIELRNVSLGESSKCFTNGVKDDSVKDTEYMQLKQTLEVEKEKKLRALADYQNLQKRIEEDRKKMSSVTNLVILGQLLDILDDFDRALSNSKDNVDGIVMVRDKIKTLIINSGLEEIECKAGEKFDSNHHEAVGVVTITEDSEDNSVNEVVQKGYKVSESGEVVRPSKVIVSKKDKKL